MFDHILNRLQGALHKSRETSAELRNPMNDILGELLVSFIIIYLMCERFALVLSLLTLS
jgi:hypothetical protein